MPTRVPSGRSFAYAVKMPLQTASLQFTRKVQTIECLETERPQSQDTVRHILLNAVGEVEKKLATIDQTFRGRAKTYSDCIRKYVPPILAMMKLNEINVIFNKAQVDRILNYICPPDTHIGSRMLRDIYEKTLQYVPDCFQEIFKDLKRILFFLDKYCLSFSTTEQKKYMDTAFHYEQKRQELINLININIEDVGKNFERFCNDGLDLKCFGIQVNDIARACECDTVLFLLMFPQACVNIENACKGIRMWIQTDEEYADYIKDDIETIEKKIESHTRAVRQFLSKSHQLEVQMNHTRRQCSDLENEIQKLQSRETSLQRQTKGLKRELSDLDLELGTLEHEKILVSRGVLATNPKNTMNTLNRKTIYVKEKINSIETRMLQLTQKTEFINQKREDLNEVRDAAATLRNETKKAKQDHLNFQLELQAMKKALEQLKKIYLLKNSPESIKKVFYGLPVKAKHQRPQAAARTRNPVTPASGKRPKSNPVPGRIIAVVQRNFETS